METHTDGEIPHESGIQLENNPKKLKEFYREFCDVIRES